MAVSEATTNLRQDGEWRTKYRDLCREFDAAQGLARDLRGLLVKLLGRFSGQAGDAGARIDEMLDMLRDGDAALNLPVLRQVVDACARAGGEDRPAWRAWSLMLDALEIPASQAFAVKLLRERGETQCEDPQWLAQLAALLNDCMTAVPAEAGDSATAAWATLLDDLLLPAEFEERAAVLRERLLAGDCEAPAHDVGRFLNELYSFLRRDLVSLGEYLKSATTYLDNLDTNLKAALLDSRASASASAEFTSSIALEVTAIDQAVTGDLPLIELKRAIDGRVRTIRASMDAFVDAQKTRQSAYEARIQELSERVSRFESESKALRAEVMEEQAKAYRDALTQLPNRLAYEERAALEFARSRRTRGPLTLAVLDLDHFKRINDAYGHKVGDKVLKYAADICRRRVRNTDLLARFGGEEFVALFPDTGLADATAVCEELRHHVEHATFLYQGKRVPVSVSIGVSALEDGDTLDSLFERADQALYAAKREGRNRVVPA
ncbi:MAG: diguanylate cyclase [Gammaproteobacteria bacterium]